LVRTEDFDVPGLPNYMNYTPLRESRAKIFSMHEQDAKRRRPIQRKMVEKSPDAFCNFHNCPGHWTEHCKSLMNNIEDMIHRGYLQQYRQDKVSGKRNTGDSSVQNRNEGSPMQKKKKEILMNYQKVCISDSEAHLRAAAAPSYELMEVTEQAEPPNLPNMTFTREDCRGVSYPHSDPLVMVLDIAEQSVHRVLIDSGAEINLIYKSCWDQMEIEEKILKKSSTPIVGFSGESVLAVGKIILPVTITDREAVTNTVPQEFHIVDAPTRYNCILGRKFTVAVTGIPSTHHQTLLFVGNDGRVGRARGDQKMARACNLVNMIRPEPEKRKGQEKMTNADETLRKMNERD
jgi:hypothetical protein